MGLRFSAGPQAGATAIHPIAVPTEPRTTCPHFGPLGGVWGGVRPSLGSSGEQLGWGQVLTVVLWGRCLGWGQALTRVLWGKCLGWGQALTRVIWGASRVGSRPHFSPLGEVSGVGSGPHCSPLRVSGMGSDPHCSPLGVSGVGSSLHDVMRSCMCRMDCCLMSDPCLRTSRTLVPVGQSNPLGLLHWAGTWS